MLDRILFVGDCLLWHPVTEALGLTQPTPAPPAQLAADRHLTVLDCRVETPQALTGDDGVCQHALRAGRPVLLLSPGSVHLQALAQAGGSWPTSPVEALVVARRTNRSGGVDHEIATLGYPLVPTAEAPLSAPLDPASASPCDAATPSPPANASDTTEALAPFVTQVLRYVEKGGALRAEGPMPDGLKYFQVSKSDSFSFHLGHNRAGTITNSLLIWGFLDQTKSASNQVVICESTFTVLPGKLRHDNDEDRGTVLTELIATLSLEDPAFSAVKQAPGSGKHTWSDALSVPIDYMDPITGQQIWTYESLVAQTLDSWSVQPGPDNDSSRLGSEWLMVDPCDGGNLKSDYKHAFTAWGMVRSMPAVSKHGGIFKSICVWRRPAKPDSSGISITRHLEGARFYGAKCVPHWCLCVGCEVYTAHEMFDSQSLDFTSLMP